MLDREELLSAVTDRVAAEAVLTKLIDARLLTSWETEAAEGQPARHQIEIVHESLLSAWPRLVRWQTQDADGAQLRDQLRQAAHLWEERGKADDLLWTGTSYLDYRAWRARYPGKLSSLEEDFSGSMKALAERTRRRKRVAFGSVLVAMSVVACVMAALWGRSQAARRRAEASKLLALAQLDVDTDPAAALAYVTKSVELDDTQAARFFALRLLQTAPVASELHGVAAPAFSPNGEWLAVAQEHEDPSPESGWPAARHDRPRRAFSRRVSRRSNSDATTRSSPSAFGMNSGFCRYPTAVRSDASSTRCPPTT